LRQGTRAHSRVQPIKHHEESRREIEPLTITAEPSCPAGTVRYSFSGHETFPFRYAWLAKGIRSLERDTDLFATDSAMVTLGVGKNMVLSIRHWCETLDLITIADRGARIAPTPLGLALFGLNGWDPYLEDSATLWLLHWLLVRQPDRASTWHLAFTRFNVDPFQRSQLIDWLLKIVAQVPNVRATSASLRRDVDVFLRTYTPAHSTHNLLLEDSFDCPLVELGLIRELEHDLYQFVRGPKPSLPDNIFVFALLDFWQRRASLQQTLSFESILHGIGSPGGAFKLSENALVERLERLPEWAHLTYDDTAGRRLVLRRDSLTGFDPLTILQQHYDRLSRENRQ